MRWESLDLALFQFFLRPAGLDFHSIDIGGERVSDDRDDDGQEVFWLKAHRGGMNVPSQHLCEIGRARKAAITYGEQGQSEPAEHRSKLVRIGAQHLQCEQRKGDAWLQSRNCRLKE